MRRLCLPAVMVAVACGGTGESFDFALMGDNPYGAGNVPKFEALIDDVNGQGDLEWVLHLGDTKRGDERCSDELLRSRFELYQRFEAPFILTPGDNDWFDCIGERAGGFDEYERLAFVRQLYYPVSERDVLEVESQASSAAYPEFVENLRWTRDGIVFSTVHLVSLSRPPTDSATAQRRMDAALAWIDQAFAVARDGDAPGVFLATQADPWYVSGLPAVMNMISCPQCLETRPGLERLYPALVEHAVAFGRPVVLAVGDTHVFRVDKPLYRPDNGGLIENFTRVETFGSPEVHWVRVEVDPTTPWVFTFHQELVDANLRR